jgi:nuclear transport factor 2 (NTF2) superfamily protein
VERSKLNLFGSRYADAWCSRKPERVAGFFSEDGSLSVNDAAPAVGRAAIAEVARGFMSAFPDMVVTMDEIARHPSGAVFRWTLTGTNSGPDGTGQRVRISGQELWRFDTNGLIAESKGHFDAAEYDRQLEFGVDG